MVVSAPESRLRLLALLTALSTAAVMAVQLEPADARPMPSNLQVEVSGDCAAATVSWDGGAGPLLVRLSRHSVVGGSTSFLDVHAERVQARSERFEQTWSSAASGDLLVTVHLFTAKGRNGAFGELIDDTWALVSCP